jgi:hypothetical protein
VTNSRGCLMGLASRRYRTDLKEVYSPHKLFARMPTAICQFSSEPVPAVMAVTIIRRQRHADDRPQIGPAGEASLSSRCEGRGWPIARVRGKPQIIRFRCEADGLTEPSKLHALIDTASVARIAHLAPTSWASSFGVGSDSFWF